MKRLCYWCAKDMGRKNGSGDDEVFYSICDDCAHKLRLEERLPQLLWGIVTLRKQNGGRDKFEAFGVPYYNSDIRPY